MDLIGKHDPGLGINPRGLIEEGKFIFWAERNKPRFQIDPERGGFAGIREGNRELNRLANLEAYGVLGINRLNSYPCFLFGSEVVARTAPQKVSDYSVSNAERYADHLKKKIPTCKGSCTRAYWFVGDWSGVVESQA